MRSERGFTLIETLIATAILIPGLVAIAWVFIYGTEVNISSQQVTTGTFLLADKMEQFRALPFTAAALTAGGNLNPDSPASGYFDYVTPQSDGSIVADTTSTNAPYLRVWQISGTDTRTITVIVYAQRNAISGERLEMARSTTIRTKR